MGNTNSTSSNTQKSKLLTKTNTETEDCDRTLSIEQKQILLDQYNKNKQLQTDIALESNLAELGLVKSVDEIEASAAANEARRNKIECKEALGGKKGIKMLKKELKKQDKLHQPSTSKN